MGGLLKMIRRTDPVIPKNRPRDSEELIRTYIWE